MDTNIHRAILKHMQRCFKDKDFPKPGSAVWLAAFKKFEPIVEQYFQSIAEITEEIQRTLPAEYPTGTTWNTDEEISSELLTGTFNLQSPRNRKKDEEVNARLKQMQHKNRKRKQKRSQK